MIGLFRIVHGAVKLIGNTDGTKIGNVGDKLKTTATLTAGEAGVSACNKSLRYRPPSLALDTVVTSTFVDAFSRTGSGLLFGFRLNLERADQDWRIRLLIDGTDDLLFDSNGISTDRMDDKKGFAFDHDSGQDPMGLILGMSLHDKIFTLAAPLQCTIEYSTSIAIKIAKNGASKKFRDGIFLLSEET